MSYSDELQRRQRKFIKKLKKALPQEVYGEAGTSGIKVGVKYKREKKKARAL